MKIREPKPDDQEKADIASELLKRLVHGHPEIDVNVWVAACLSSIAASYEHNGHAYLDFFNEMQEMIRFYKRYWEE